MKMKKKIFTSFATGLLAAGMTSSLTAQIIEITPTALQTPYLVNLAAQNGQVAVMFTYGTAAVTPTILAEAHSNNSGATFSAPAIVDNPGPFWSMQTPSLKYDGSGNLNLMFNEWTDFTNTWHGKSANNGASWSFQSTGGSVLARAGGNAYTISGSGTSSVIRALNYEGGDGYAQYKVSTNGGTTWTNTNVALELPGSRTTGAALSSSDKFYTVTSINPRTDPQQGGVRIETVTAAGVFAAYNIYNDDTQAQISLSNDHNIINLGGTTMIATYARSGNVFTVKTTDDGANWGTPVQLTLAASASIPVIASLSDNITLMLAWVDGGNIVYQTSGDAGASWSASTTFSGYDVGSGDITYLDLISDGSAFQMAWIEDSKVYYSAIPEPSSVALLAAAVSGLLVARRRRA